MKATAVAFFIFNRPDTTQRVFDRIADWRPRRLLVVADGARQDRPGEETLCQQTRAIVDRVDWPCEIEQCYSTVNLGCRDRTATGLNWVFERVEEAIILEDDCLPDPTFFRFASELLEKYRDDPQIMAISGDNFQPRSENHTGSYYFSRYFHCWGWATWRRAWSEYDMTMAEWPQLSTTDWLLSVLDGDAGATQYWAQQFTAVCGNHINTWDYQFVYSIWKAEGLTILPRSNLVSNLGFRPDATHTSDPSNPLAALPLEPMSFPLQHPEKMRDRLADEWTQQHLFSQPPMSGRRAGKYWSRLQRLFNRMRAGARCGA